jgi:hypothetical protein
LKVRHDGDELDAIELGEAPFEIRNDHAVVVSVDTGGNFPNGSYGLALIRPRTIGLMVGLRFWGS